MDTAIVQPAAGVAGEGGTARMAAVGKARRRIAWTVMAVVAPKSNAIRKEVETDEEERFSCKEVGTSLIDLSLAAATVFGFKHQ